MINVCIFLADTCGYVLQGAKASQAIQEVIQKRRYQPGQSRCDLLQHLINEGNRPDNGQRMTTRDIIDQMSELLLAGSETTSGTIACLF